MMGGLCWCGEGVVYVFVGSVVGDTMLTLKLGGDGGGGKM